MQIATFKTRETITLSACVLLAILSNTHVLNAQGAQDEQTSTVPAASDDNAGTQLPAVEVVQSPSAKAPVSVASPVKKKPAVQSAQTQTTPAATTNAGNANETLLPPAGTIVVVDDAFVSVTVATQRDALASKGGNIADILDKRPGISGSTFAPGANRPIIRGFDNYRVRVQENGIGSADVSALSEDHAVPIDPFAASQVSVIRGPATLRYGNQAIGGVVAIENQRIPTHAPRRGASGEIKGSLSSVDDGREGAFRAAVGANGIVVQADGFRRRTDDYDTPHGTQFNSFVEADGASVGASLVGSKGFVGLAISRYSSFYGIPGEEAAELSPRIDLEQNKLLSKGAWQVNGFGIETVRYWFGASEYAHNEVVDEGEGDEVGSRFTNDEYETRVELQHVPIATAVGNVRGAFGVQYVDRNTRGQSFEGDSLLETAKTNAIAGFWFEELDVAPGLTLQAASRIQHDDIEGVSRLDPLNAAAPINKIAKSYSPISGSLGARIQLPQGTTLSVNGQYVERAPDAAELFSKGIHEATGTFEVGNPNLKKESAKTIEAGLRRSKGKFRFDTAAYYTRYNAFIFKNLTGLECEGVLASCGNVQPGAEETLDQVLFAQRDARFYGVELAGQYDVAPIWNGVWGIEGQYDFVHARLDGGENVPRIPPHRLGGGLFYRGANWFAKAGILHAFDQNRFGINEVSTPGYTLLSAELTYSTTTDWFSGQQSQVTIGIKGENLANDEVLNHASFKRREDVLGPGASVRVFGSVKLN